VAIRQVPADVVPVYIGILHEPAATRPELHPVACVKYV